MSVSPDHSLDTEKDQFEQLIRILDRLIAPGGCPWDREQTLQTMRGSILEEACEVIDAICEGDMTKISSEIGDLLFVAIFLTRIEQSIDLVSVLKSVNAKLIRRHPHVFGEESAENSEEVLKRWEEIKADEKEHINRTDRIPKSLPALARAYEIGKKRGFHALPPPKDDEERLGQKILELIEQYPKIDPEQALRKTVLDL